MPDYPQTSRIKSKPARTGLFQRALIGELASNGLLVFAVLLGIVVISQLIRLLGEAVSGLIAVDGVLALLGFSAMNYLPVLLSISLFVSIILTLSRCYRDSEMVVWFCCGAGLGRWIRPVMLYALPVVGVIALLSLVLSPWALQKADEFKKKLESRDDVAAATPGSFRESKQADRVYFVENMYPGSNRVSNVFVRSEQNGKLGTMVARQGVQETLPNGDRFLVLLNGTRYEGVPGQRDYSIVEFERYAIRIDSAPPKLAEPWARTMPTVELWRNRTTWDIAELEWRVGLPISALILALLAIPLGHVNPRAGRSLNLVLAIVLYMLYNNMISVTNAWVGQGKLSPGVGLWGIHTVMLVITALMFYRRMTLFSLRRVMAKKSQPSSDELGVKA
ncbi:LPS export ABC transporter permease LptF [Candidatus Ferrigenium straubiae]|jgi:lipopolysaccharide export system permease protein|uniref:LPS export ABC transporter permease LptF n=1 Tax=Candidatus Ferrigenium straubiae TaxID=2919506 RepID=UPI003F4AA300